MDLLYREDRALPRDLLLRPGDRAGMLPVSEDDLYHYWRIRDSLPRNDPRHALYGPMEHRQFAHETVRDNPLMALPLAAAIPAYTGAKALGLTNARSPASTDEMWAGYHGLVEGMLDWMVPSAHANHEQSETVQRPDGKWINVYGRGMRKRGQQLPNSGVYDTVEEAEQAARARSEAYRDPRGSILKGPRRGMLDGTMYPNRTPRTRHGGGGVRG